MSATSAGAFDDDAWYAWDAEDGDQGWLLTYVDVLSVILAMLLVLLARLGPFEPAPETAAATAPIAAPVVTEVIAAPEPPAPLVVAATEASAAPAEIPAPATVPVSPDAAPDPRLFTALAAIKTLGTLDRDEHGVTLKIADVVLFDSARARLKHSAIPVLEEVARTLEALGEVDVIVQGHTDDRPVQGGTYESNWALGAARANAVAAFLLEHGFPPVRLSSVSFADTRPVADNGTEAGRARNRRVEIRAEFAGEGIQSPTSR